MWRKEEEEEDTVKHSKFSFIHRVVLELSFSESGGGVHDKLHISSTGWCDLEAATHGHLGTEPGNHRQVRDILLRLA